MNIQERQQLTQFLQQLTQAQVTQKDGEAETLIREAGIRQPDAAYLLVQRAMLLDQALQGSQAQVSRLQGELDQMRSQTRAGVGSNNFLDANAWGNTPVPRGTSTPQTPIGPTSQAPVNSPTATPTPSAWGSGMIGNIAATAAGVVAGGFLFQGIEHLLGNHSSSSGVMNNLSSNGSAEHQDTTAFATPIDDAGSSSGLFDTSSVDSFIAADTDNSL
ncbi:MAG: DUF2076 family protein [Proteobacteria bacterium]|nr:DUF2076 family protein [Pseudomonadota bacterium]